MGISCKSSTTPTPSYITPPIPHPFTSMYFQATAVKTHTLISIAFASWISLKGGVEGGGGFGRLVWHLGQAS